MVDATKVIIWDTNVEGDALIARLKAGIPVTSLKLKRGVMERIGLPKIALIQKTYGINVFADAKISGVPHEIMDTARNYLNLHPWMLNVMVGGSVSNGLFARTSDTDELDGLKRFADACREHGTLSCGVTVLTSKSEDIVATEYNQRTAAQQVLVYAEWMVAAGFTDIVCSPQEAAVLRRDSHFDSLTINTPGVRMPGDDVNDQSRIDTPAGALAAGADRLVVGSSLNHGGTMDENFVRIAATLNA